MKIIDFPLTCHRHGPILTNVMPGAIESGQLLLLEVVNCQDVGQDHDHHRDVEGKQGPKDQEVLVVHLADLVCRHDVLDVEDGEDGYRRGQEETQAPCEDNFVQYGVFPLGPLSQGPSDSSVAANWDEHEVEDGDGAGQHVARLVEDTPSLWQRPAAWAELSATDDSPDRLTCEEGDRPEWHHDETDEHIGHGQGHEEVVGHVLQLPGESVQISYKWLQNIT